MNTHNYYKTNEVTIIDFTEENIEKYYDQGYKFTRIAYGNMQQTRSLRVNLNKFELSSENRRVLRKYPNLVIKTIDLPLSSYDWNIGKLAKDFYEVKFGEHTFSANKIKELLTIEANFNTLLEFKNIKEDQTEEIVGYAICYKSSNILHYSYPFYKLDQEKTSLGIAMMTKTIEYFKGQNLKYVYLGGVTKPTDTYKLQFEGLEYYEKTWLTSINDLKAILNNSIIL